MKKYINKKSIIITSVVLLLLVAVGTTLAYVFTATDPVENTFKPSKVACAVVENNGTPVTGSLINTGDTKSNVQIKNTGDTDAYIRVAVVVNWMSADGSKVWAQKPIQGTDYTITYNLEDGWFDGGDGFYYYNAPVAPGGFTSVLIEEAKLIGTPPTGIDNTEYFLSIEIVASAIQSKPTTTVSNQWGVKVSDDGTISK